jgi:hypothetical protein
MRAKVGDTIVVRGNSVTQPDRQGRVTDVHGEDGGPPYVVSWADGHESLYFPGPDASVAPRERGTEAGPGL